MQENKDICHLYTVEVYPKGNTIWRNKNGQRHRLEGPATIYADGHEAWYQNDLLHREDGPAIVYNSRQSHDLWYLDGVNYLEDDWRREVARRNQKQEPSDADLDSKIMTLGGKKYKLTLLPE